MSVATIIKSLTELSSQSKTQWTPTSTLRSRHTLYAILRQARDLPDDTARTYIKHHALSRWRTSTSIVRSGSHDPPSTDQKTRWNTQLASAQKSLSYLVRANAGDIARLRYVLEIVYGRTGKRRHQLLSPLLPAQTPNDPGWKTRAPALTDKLRALLESQITARPPTCGTRRNPRSLRELRVKLPEKDIWGRSLPVVREQNLRIEWYHTLLSRAMPPIPDEEWERLRKLAFGEGSGDKGVQGCKRTAVEIVIHHGQVSTEAERLADALPLGRGVTKASRNEAYTSKILRRVYVHVFSQCCKMAWDATRERWVFTWGHEVMAEHAKRSTMRDTRT